MCKNCKDRNARVSHGCDFDIDKNIGHAIVENGAKEHLKEYEKGGKKKFDYKKYIKKHNKKQELCFNDLKFTPCGYGNQMAQLHLDNGFDVRVVLDKDSFIEDIEIEYNYRETGKRLSVFQAFPDLVESRKKLLRAADVMIIDSALRFVQGLPNDSQEKFLDDVHDRTK